MRAALTSCAAVAFLVASALVPAVSAEAVTCTSQHIQPRVSFQHRADDELKPTRMTAYETVYSYACGSRDRFTDMRVGYARYNGQSVVCNGVRAVVINPSSIAGRNLGAIRLPCRSKGYSRTFSLYNKTYTSGSGDRCASASGYLDIAWSGDPKFRLPQKCQW